MSGTKILVIDDDKQIRDLVAKILTLAGYQVSTACNGNEGIEMFKANPADLVISDILMPEKEGLETISELHRHNPALKIIAISGGSKTLRFDPLQAARRFGAHNALAKPFGKDELMRVVTETLAQPTIPKSSNPD